MGPFKPTPEVSDLMWGRFRPFEWVYPRRPNHGDHVAVGVIPAARLGLPGQAHQGLGQVGGRAVGDMQKQVAKMPAIRQWVALLCDGDFVSGAPAAPIPVSLRSARDSGCPSRALLVA